eukprot:scaffold240412_cov17-Prasinocladus_malaysianus.AAC.2
MVDSSVVESAQNPQTVTMEAAVPEQHTSKVQIRLALTHELNLRYTLAENIGRSSNKFSALDV